MSLLPATSSGRIEAAVRLPGAARLSLSWRAANPQAATKSDAVQVWLHREDGEGELLRTVPFAAAAQPASASIDLGAHAGETCLLRATSGQVPVTWLRAELSGLASTAATAWRVAPRPGAPDVVVYLIDTLRPDVLGTYGGPGPTPVIDRLAAEGMVFERAYSTTSWTRPAVASLFTSLPVAAHRVSSETFALPEGVLTLAERFRLRGYQTLGVVANGHVFSSFNFDQGFETYDELRGAEPAAATWDPGLEVTNVNAEQVHAQALRRLAEVRDPRRPLFLYVQTVEPHSPYHPPRWLLPEARPAVNVNNFLLRSIDEADGASPQMLQDLALSYRGAVAYADHELGRFLAALAPRLAPGHTLLAVTSDHGEGFYEHHLVGHRHWLYEEMIRIPLILHGPGVAAGRRDVAPFSLADVASILLGLADQSAAAARLPAKGERAKGERAIHGEFSQGAVLVQGEWKLTYHGDYPEAQRFALFNLRQDPAERIDLFTQQPRIAGRLEAEFRRWRAAARSRAVEPLPVDVSLLEQHLRQNLDALGYLK
ncbi:MAG TPA: sulfatase [Thermoanaerobaculia bacterium]|nr:sulfatase [Thermoanaerobaculia bacterium]